MSRRRYAQSAAAFLVAACLACAGFFLATVPGHAASSAGIGVYRGAASPSQVGAFGSWLGKAPTYAQDFFAGGSWAAIESPDWWLDGWSGTPYNVEYSVPIIPSTGGTLQEGATGAYNSHFQKLAQTLVAHGQGNAILRPGWEFNGNWYKWFAGSDPASFAAYWRQIVTTMRAVSPGLRFDWCPTLGAGNMSSGVEPAYPGDAYVDYIGTDVYDQSWGANRTNPAVRWNGYLTQQNGLNWVASFAGAHGKPISIPEWGLSIRTDGHGGGDNAYFIQHMYDWINANNVAFHMYFEFDASDGAHRLMLAQFPVGAAKYRQLFGGAAPVTSSSSTASSSTSTTTPPSTTTSTTTTPTTSTTRTTTTTTTPPTTTTPTKKCRAKRCPGRRLLWAAVGATAVGQTGNAKPACAQWRVASHPPAWFWVWVRWKLGRSEFKGHASAPAYRPSAVPRTVPPTAWKQYHRFVAGKSVVIRVCAR